MARLSNEDLLEKIKDMVQTQERYLTTEQVSTMIGVTVETLNHWRCDKKGPDYYKVGGKVVYAYKDVIAYMESRRVRCHRRVRK